MSRIGRNPITIPAGVTVAFEKGIVTVKGPLGTLTQDIASKFIDIKQENGTVTVMRSSEVKEVKAKHGLYRALINNMIGGVTKGFSRTLIVNGVGYKSSVSGQKLVLNIGFSHPVELIAPDGISVACNNNEITVKGISKEAVGQFAAKVKAARKVEPYHGYGIRYSDEVVIRKEGKTAGK